MLAGAEDTAEAIERLAVRGAPLIGVAAAYGLAMAVARDRRSARSSAPPRRLAAARPDRAQPRVGGRARARRGARRRRAWRPPRARRPRRSTARTRPRAPRSPATAPTLLEDARAGAAARPDALQHRRAGRRRARDRARRDRRARRPPARPRARLRDAAAAAGRAADGVGAGPAGIPHELVVDGAAAGLIRARRGRRRDHRLRPGRRQRRRRQQGRHLRPRARRPRRRHPVRRRRPVLVDRPRRCPTATGSRSRSAPPTRCAAARRRAADRARGRRAATPRSTSRPPSSSRALVTERGVAPARSTRPTRAPARGDEGRAHPHARTTTVVEEAPDPGRRARARSSAACSPARPAAPTSSRSTSGASSRPCSATSRRARWSRSARASTASRSATAWRSTTTRRAASAGAAAAATRRCASASAPRGSTPAASPSTCASRPSWSTSCCRSTAWTRCSPPSPSRSPARCAPSAAAGVERRRRRARGRRRLRAACCTSPPRTRRGVEAVWVREPQPERLERAERWGATAHGNEPVDVAIVCTPRSEAIVAAAEALAPGGALCVYAPPPPGSPLAIDGNAVFMRELDVTASWSAGPADMRAALALLARGAVRAARARSRTGSRSRRPAPRSQRSAAARRSRRSCCREGGGPPRARGPARRGRSPSRRRPDEVVVRDRGRHHLRDRREDVAPRPSRAGRHTPRGSGTRWPACARTPGSGCSSATRVACGGVPAVPRRAAADLPRHPLGARRLRRGGGGAGSHAARRSPRVSTPPARRWPSRSARRCTRVDRAPAARASPPTPACSAAARWAGCSPRCSCTRAAR